MDILILVIAFVIILLGAELFTNGIEWFGRKLQLAEGAVGSVLAAVGTALPETMTRAIGVSSRVSSPSHMNPAGRRWAMSSTIRPGSSGGPPASGSMRAANIRTQPIAMNRIEP